MVKKEALFVLIHSLSKSEKRYFRLFCTRESGGWNYLQLFDAIANQDEYNEQAIKKKFKDQKFVRQMHVTKNYLRRLILKSLRNFHAGVSKDAELKDILRNIELLYNKELYVHCETELKRAYALANKYELLTGMIEVIKWQRKLEQTLRPHNYPAIMRAIINEENTLRLLQNNIDYWKVAVDTSANLSFEDERPDYAGILPDNPDDALTLEAKVLHYNTAYLRNLKTGDNARAELALHTLIELLEKYPEYIKEEPGMYVSSINNLVSYLVFDQQYKAAMELIRKAKEVYDTWRLTSENRTLLKQVLRTYNIELEIYRNMNALEAREAFIERTEAFIKANVYKIPKEYLISFWFQLASIHFNRNDFSRALVWINKLINNRYKGIRTDLQVQGRMLNLMIHLELKNFMVLRYYVDSTKRFMKKVNHQREFEHELLKFFIKIGRTPLLEFKGAFTKLRQKLYPDNGEPLVPEGMLGYINYKTWIEDKIK